MARDIGNSWREVCDEMHANDGRNHNTNKGCGRRQQDR
jgi:hypothetical protein